MITMLSLLALLAPCAPTVEKIPERVLLTKMVESRKSFATADIVYTQRMNTPEGRVPRYRRNRYAGRDWIQSDIADPDGIVLHQQLGQPYSCSQANILTTGDTRFMSYEHSAVGEVYRVEPGMPRNVAATFPSLDCRAIGLIPELHAGMDVDAVMANELIQMGDADLTQKDMGHGIISVTATTPTVTPSKLKITWQIDTNKGYAPISVKREMNGRFIAGATSQLKLYGDHVWFPETVIVHEVRRDGAVSVTFDFTKAEFDLADQPAALTPTDIGLVPYSPVNWQLGQGTQGVWTGTEIITAEEGRRRLAAGLIPKGAMDEWHARQEQCKNSGGGRFPSWMGSANYGLSKPWAIDEWEAYVRRFCVMNKLDDRQKASSKSIRDDCYKMARPLYLKAVAAKEKDTAKREAMFAPVAAIFTNSLVPRLESLLTIPQSQPAKREPVTSRPG